MNRALSKNIFLLVTLFLAASCQKEPYVEILDGQEELFFFSKEDHQELSFIANKPWKISSSADWCIVSQTSGFGDEKSINTVNIYCSTNREYDARYCTLSLIVGDLTRTIRVSQGAGSALIIKNPYYSVSNEEHRITIDLETNIVFDVYSSVNWVQNVTPTKGLSPSQIILHIDLNDSYSEREAKVTVKERNGKLSETITIRQSQRDGIVINPSSFNLSNIAQTVEFEVLYNCEYDFVIPEGVNKTMVSSIIESNTKVLSSKIYRLSVTENNSFDSREGTITVRQRGGNIAGTLKIEQSAKDTLGLSVKELHYPYQGGDSTVFITSSTDYSIDYKNVNWISIIQTPATRGLSTHDCIIRVSENSGAERNAVINIRSSFGTQTLNIHQDAAPLFSVPTSVVIDCLDNASTSFQFNASGEWTISQIDGKELVLSKTSGTSHDASITLTTIGPNCTNEDIVSHLLVRCGDFLKIIEVKQVPAFKFDSLHHTLSASGGNYRFNFVFPRSDYSSVRTYDYDNGFITLLNSNSTPGNCNSQTGSGVAFAPLSQISMYMQYSFMANYGAVERQGKFRLCFEENGQLLTSEWVTVTQLTGDYSHDYSFDGLVKVLRNHSIGEGFPLVIVGDGFKDTDIASGKYDTAMLEACQYLFSIEPMTALQNYFDVWSITAVSPSNTFDGLGTRFKSAFKGGTHIEGDDEIAYQYAAKVVPADKRKDMVIVVVINSTRYAGTCYLHYVDYYNSTRVLTYSVAYVPMSTQNGMTFENVIHHEVCGHGIGKLADEYTGSGTISSSAQSELLIFQRAGARMNVDIHSTVSETSWTNYANDPRFGYEQIGTYQGGYTYSYGVYRPTYTSIMVTNKGIFNAPSRAQIYKQVLQIAHRNNWSFDYESFVSFDSKYRESMYTRSPIARSSSMINGNNLPIGFTPLHPPVFVKDERIE